VLFRSGRFADAEADFQEAFEICVQLGERSLISWTAAELALVLLGRGRASEARRLLDDDRVVGVTGEPGAEAIVVMARVAVDLADGNRALAEGQVPGLREEALRDGATGFENGAASRLWWLGRLFGPEAAGGEDELRAARERLERVHWHRALREPDLLLTAIGGTARWPAEDAVVPG